MKKLRIVLILVLFALVALWSKSKLPPTNYQTKMVKITKMERDLAKNDFYIGLANHEVIRLSGIEEWMKYNVGDLYPVETEIKRTSNPMTQEEELYEAIFVMAVVGIVVSTIMMLYNLGEE